MLDLRNFIEQAISGYNVFNKGLRARDVFEHLDTVYLPYRLLKPSRQPYSDFLKQWMPFPPARASFSMVSIDLKAFPEPVSE